jgi:phosphoadenosine phosphosulfate reductase
VDEIDGRVKISPLADWSLEQVDRYLAENRVPVHPLYARGYASIGCDPCTRAVRPEEDDRAGRWWWEQDQKKECGIHVTVDGLVRRA